MVTRASGVHAIDTTEQTLANKSALLRKELGLRDLVLMQVLFVVGLGWIGTAAKLGPSHVVFWFVAVTLFYLPSAVVVIYLTTLMPLEGGLYQWAKIGLSDLAGFLVAWNLWLYVIVNTSEVGLQTATYLSYSLGTDARWMAGSRPLIVVLSSMLVGSLAIISALGLGVGKWLHNAGGMLILTLFAAMVVLPVLNYARGSLPPLQPFSLALPSLTLLNLNILGKMGFGALGGFDYVAIMAGECRDPVKTIGRSVVIAVPIIAGMFILGTASVLCFIRPADVDLIGPIPQVLDAGARSLGMVTGVVPIVIMTIAVVRVAQASVNFTGSARLPMVAGWDDLLPAWFSRLHPRRRTPVNSILFVAAVTLGVAIASVMGVGEQEAFQLLNNASGIFYALTYLALFAIPILGLRTAPPLWLRVVACSGFLMTLLYVVLSIFPIVPVINQVSFTAKIVLVILVCNGVGAVIFLAGERRRVKG